MELMSYRHRRHTLQGERASVKCWKRGTAKLGLHEQPLPESNGLPLEHQCAYCGTATTTLKCLMARQQASESHTVVIVCYQPQSQLLASYSCSPERIEPCVEYPWVNLIELNTRTKRDNTHQALTAINRTWLNEDMSIES